ncbi:MAG: hypothetical protein LBV21_05555 [Candidatus Adiutrix sp.]|jgi:CRISPR/Cas system CSM-associated protein Csm3 (group 7 of RAMP superfamily)|nr:hypothetical protein [Candidatus Adiutrix sp.]
MRFNLEITFLSDWLVGSGLSDGARADAGLARDARGLLYLPGRAIKGALRESAHRLGLARPDLAPAETRLFGVDCRPASPEGLNKAGEAKSFNQPGALRVGEGRLPEAIEALLLAAKTTDRAAWVTDLTVTRAQTALTEARTARPHSLRTLECGLPGLTFQAELAVDNPAAFPGGDQWLQAYFRTLCALTKSLGGHRSRGLGRCRLTLDPAPAGTLVEPPPPLDFTTPAPGVN